MFVQMNVSLLVSVQSVQAGPHASAMCCTNPISWGSLNKMACLIEPSQQPLITP
jgi:hypothetical protein